ncbi:hypothetical protein [Pacificimonas flava]|uniref:Uncharacterized protein n=1 Tax=Pacificimonas flava TaxID=1234595 RepID=M2SC59_9SPHN|nr:hypothetical protein [Pacificimonas flava]EMD82955.1 hypothetical protein C725_1553 [Pacificimonas flava]MBB5280115.1 hypothetical protein [Pacificimonas flava]
MFTNVANQSVVRSLVGVFGAALMTISVFYAAVGPDPRADEWTAPSVQVASSADGAIAA